MFFLTFIHTIFIPQITINKHMKKINILAIAIIMSFILASCGKTETITQPLTEGNTAQESTEPKTIIALGDSITAWYSLPIEDSYPSQLEVLLQDNWYNYKLINAWVSGNTSIQLLNRLDLYLEDEENIPDIAIVVIGWNDGLRGQSTEELEANIQKIIEKLQEKNVEVVLWGMQIPPNNWLRYYLSFKNLYGDVADDTDVALIDFFLEDVATKWIYNLPDKIHPNKDWYAIIAENTFEFLKKKKIIQND